MLLDDTLYGLPEELIATAPAETREASRLLKLNRSKGTFSDGTFTDVLDLIRPGDCVVMNNTRVFRARLFGECGGKKIELLLTERENDREWLCYVKHSKKFAAGAAFNLQGLTGTMGEKLDDMRRITFDRPVSFEDIDRVGTVPLPPYIVNKRRRDGNPEYVDSDFERYQSVAAKIYGSVAAPTASLHFTEELIGKLRSKGVRFAEVTLHVGAGTFKPIDTERAEDFHIHPEWVQVGEKCIRALQETRAAGGRIVAVGTTAVRALESMAAGELDPQKWKAFEGITRIFIYPPYRFCALDALITNFHMPRSTLLLLVQAFGGTDLVRAAYAHAVENRYRFFSYGDAMWLE